MACAPEPSEERSDMQDVAVESTAGAFDLSSQKLAEREAAGRAGDAEAALDVALFYNSRNTQNSPDERRLASEWFRISAENGSVTGALHYAVGLAQSRERASCAKALDWLDRAAAMERATDDDRARIAQTRADVVDQMAECRG